MRRVGGDDSKFRAGARKFLDLAQKKFRHAGEVVRFQEIDSLLEVDAVNDELRVTAVAFPVAIHRDDVLVVVDRALRPDAADHAQSFHVGRLGFLIQWRLLRSIS